MFENTNVQSSHSGTEDVLSKMWARSKGNQQFLW